MKAALAAALLIGAVAAVAAPAMEVATLATWPGPYGGLPPVDRATPASLAAEYAAALAEYGRELDAVASNPVPADFDNTVAALDRAGRRLNRADAILQIFATSQADPAWREVEKSLTPQRDALQARATTDAAIFARVRAVHERRTAIGDAEARRLVELTYRDMVQAGAALDAEQRARLAGIEARLSGLLTRFNQNLQGEARGQFVLVTDASRLGGLPEAVTAAAAKEAVAQGRPGSWAFANARPTVWAVQTNARDRALRQEVWQRWMGRGMQPGEFDNRPVTSQILQARQDKARLLGYPSFAHYVLASRMVGTPERALGIMERTWQPVLAADARRVAELSALAKPDGVDDIRPWDRIYYLDRLTRTRFGIDTQEIAQYFSLPSIRDAMFAAAGDSFGFTFERLQGVATVSPDIEVYLAKRQGKPAGVVYLDLRPRPSKQPGSWTMAYRRTADGAPGDLPVVGMYSSPPAAAPGQEILLPYEYANVLFHEFGHVLHMISARARYRGTGSLAVPWDFVEVPSLLNERWLLTDATLDRLPHHITGKPMPADLREKLRAWRQYERVFSVNPEYLASALVDQRLHMMGGRDAIDVSATEARILEEYGMPKSVDPVMRAAHAVHTFSRAYAAGVYTYLWSDILAADLAESFAPAALGFHDRAVGDRYFDTVLSRGAVVPVEQAFRDFRGRAPEEGALLRRYGLDTPPR